VNNADSTAFAIAWLVSSLCLYVVPDTNVSQIAGNIGAGTRLGVDIVVGAGNGGSDNDVVCLWQLSNG
jgi:hypothetical protein